MTAYIHTDDVHSLSGARRGLSYVLGHRRPHSLLDVGCGAGAWLAAAREAGVASLCGIDAAVPERRDDVGAMIQTQDLTGSFDLGRRFDVVLCLEVAEHLPARSAAILTDSLCRHADEIYFSAACPNQFGQNHINCQWPHYWQGLFNQRGFVCDDAIRWRMWADPVIEPWYRQNMFRACKSVDEAGSEPRLAAVLHPEMLPFITGLDAARAQPPPRLARRLAARLGLRRGTS